MKRLRTLTVSAQLLASFSSTAMEEGDVVTAREHHDRLTETLEQIDAELNYTQVVADGK